MKKLFGALVMALVAGIGAYFSPEAAWGAFLGFSILLAAIVISWAGTSLFRSGHTAAAQFIGFASSMVLGYLAWGTSKALLAWMMASMIPAALAPKLYEKLFRTDNAARAVLTVIAAKCGVGLRWGKDGNLSGVAVGDDKTVVLGVGAPTEVPPELKDDPTEPKP